MVKQGKKLFAYISGALFYDLSSFIKRDPVSTIIVGLWMKYYNLAIVPIPGMIPPTTHIKIKSMLHFEVLQILHN